MSDSPVLEIYPVGSFFMWGFFSLVRLPGPGSQGVNLDHDI